ncbi:MAG: MotA/TolQ/ExbB proton channel family protein [Planctomycetia bacterium]|nr:MotA/TolQ/ExbB proton channel family protein [Planctomycetia bacterium]
MYEIISSGGTVGVLIGFLSLAAIALAVEQFLSLRNTSLMPEGLAQQLRDLLVSGRIQDADILCRENPSCLSFIVSMGLSETDGEWEDVEKALEEAAGEQSAKLFRRVEFLSVIGNIAPMLGLLGTVLGMITAFQQIADTQGTAQAPELARGIYQALVTTVEGLIVAIPALAAFAFFRNRVDQVMADVTFTVQHIFLPLKRQLRGKNFHSIKGLVPEMHSVIESENSENDELTEIPSVAQRSAQFEKSALSEKSASLPGRASQSTAEVQKKRTSSDPVPPPRTVPSQKTAPPQKTVPPPRTVPTQTSAAAQKKESPQQNPKRNPPEPPAPPVLK